VKLHQSLGLILLLAALPAAPARWPRQDVPACGDVRLSEFLPQPAGVDWDGDGAVTPGDQWIELYNAGDAACDLGGWWLAKGQGAPGYAIPSGTVIAPGGYIVFFRSVTGVDLGYASGEVWLTGPGGAADGYRYYTAWPDASYNRNLATGAWDSNSAIPPSPGQANNSLPTAEPPSPTPLPSATPSATETPAPSGTPTATPSPAATATPTATATPSATPSLAPTGSATPSPAPTPTRSATPSPAPTPTRSATPSRTPTSTRTATPSRTPTPTSTGTATPSRTPTPTRSATPSATSTLTATASATARPSPSCTLTPSATAMPSPAGRRSATGATVPAAADRITVLLPAGGASATPNAAEVTSPTPASPPPPLQPLTAILISAAGGGSLALIGWVVRRRLPRL